MRCPFCGCINTSVKDSRTNDDETQIKRRRFCGDCGARFVTHERVQLKEFTVVKKDGNKVPFDREKLQRSITTALRKRPFDPQRIERVVNSIIRQLETIDGSEIPTQMIGDSVCESLMNLDPIAYIRFASVYKEFETVQDFVTLLQTLKEPSDDS